MSDLFIFHMNLNNVIPTHTWNIGKLHHSTAPSIFMVISYKAKAQVSKTQMNRRVRRPRKLKTFLRGGERGVSESE